MEGRDRPLATRHEKGSAGKSAPGSDSLTRAHVGQHVAATACVSASSLAAGVDALLQGSISVSAKGCSCSPPAHAMSVP